MARTANAQVVAISRKAQKSNRGPVGIYKYQELKKRVPASPGCKGTTSLYETHFNHRLLAKSIAAEPVTLESENPTIGQHWNEALYNCQHPLVQAAMYYEHRASWLKGAVEYMMPFPKKNN